jgi:histidine triad (HIT) family protein
MKCEYCEIVSGMEKYAVLFEDEQIMIVVKDLIITPGQITIFPKEHFTILEMVPDVLLEKCSILANKVSIAIFESLGSHGTNILIQNGLGAGQKVPHFAMEIIPRIENDNLPLQWQPKQLMDDDMDTALLMIKQESDKLVNIGKKEKKEIVTEKKEEQPKVVEDKEGKKNYLLKSINRLP